MSVEFNALKPSICRAGVGREHPLREFTQRLCIFVLAELNVGAAEAPIENLRCRRNKGEDRFMYVVSFRPLQPFSYIRRNINYDKEREHGIVKAVSSRVFIVIWIDSRTRQPARRKAILIQFSR